MIIVYILLSENVTFKKQNDVMSCKLSNQVLFIMLVPTELVSFDWSVL